MSALMTEDEAARVLRVCTRTLRKARLGGQDGEDAPAGCGALAGWGGNMSHPCIYCDNLAVHGDVCAECIADEMDHFDDDDFDPEGPAFECAGYNDGTRFYCPLWGSEECDWECPNGGLG